MRRVIEKLSWREIKGSHRLMILIVLTLGLLNFFFGERVPAGGGFNVDGVLYAKMVRNLDKMISDGLLSNYYAQRILPSAIVRSMLLLSNAQISDTNIIHAFELYNLVLLLGACWAWRRLADNFSISLGGRWLGFGGLFMNFQCSKQTFYTPVMTDTTALLLGLLLLLFYVEKRPVALLATAILGAFAWQVVSIYGAMLLFFLKTDIPKEAITLSPRLNSAEFDRVAKFRWMALLIGSISSFIILPACMAWIGIDRESTWDLDVVQRLITSLPSLAGAGLALVMLVGSVIFVRAVFASLRKTSLLLIVLSGMAVLVPWVIVRSIANPAQANASSFMAVAGLLIYPPWGMFLLPLVALAVFWGPTVLLLLLNWRAFCLEARKMGPGFVAVVGMSLPLGLCTEPRFITCAWPFFVLGAVRAMERTETGATFKFVFPALTILFAQFWMKINLAPWPPGDLVNTSVFPKQVWYMHYGYWMAWWAYWLHLGVIGLCIVWLRRTLRPARRTEVF